MKEERRAGRGLRPAIDVLRIVATLPTRFPSMQAVNARATEAARAAGCEWLHVDFDDHLRDFYFSACGLRPTCGGER